MESFIFFLRIGIRIMSIFCFKVIMSLLCEMIILLFVMLSVIFLILFVLFLFGGILFLFKVLYL